MKRLNFIGIGGAINVELGGNCCYYKENNNLLLIDVCECATEKLKKLNVFKDLEKIYIVITHTHSDHIAGLGILVWYCNFVLNIKPKIIYSSRKCSKNIRNILKLTGVNKKYVSFIKDSNFKFEDIRLKMISTKHVKELQCFGIMFSDKSGKYYYTGDTNDIEFVKRLLCDKDIKKIYSEVCSETSDVHIKYDDIKKLDKKKLILMHFDTVDLYNKAKKDGFEVAEIENKILFKTKNIYKET